MTTQSWLTGGGVMGATVRAHPWATTPLGPLTGWPQSLRTAVSICLGAPQPAMVVWGESRTVLFNDSHLAMHGAGGFGEPLAVEIPQSVWSGGEAAELRDSAVVPLRDEGGRVAGALVLGHDADTVAKAFGHDLRNPLAAILTAAQLLERRGGAEPRLTEPARRIVASAERMSRMIDQLLCYVQLRAQGGVRLTRAPVDLNGLMRSQLDTLQLAWPDWKVSFEAMGDAAGELDGERVAAVISNLGDNAARHAAGHPCRVRLDGCSASVLAVTVENEGVLPAEVALFEPFSVSGPTRGLGLGLCLSRAYVQAHGGALNGESLDGWTRFTALFPRQPRPMNAR